jgi:alkylated DNA nucleotide flippase Atl1
VIVLIGHTKEHIADRPFEQLLRLIKEDPALQVVSFSEVARLLPSSRERVQLGDVMEPLMEANGR